MGNSLRLVAFLVLFFNIHPVCANTYGPVKAGGILWHIAAQVSPSRDLSRYQIMFALLKANPNAFSVSCNVNSLKIGAMLHIPSSTLIRTVSAQQATKLINEQFSAWKNRRSVPIRCESIEEAQLIQTMDNELEPENLNVIPTLKKIQTQANNTNKMNAAIEPKIAVKHEVTQPIEPSVIQDNTASIASTETKVVNLNQTPTS
uniref:FimV/HubP family polar landmark protein n=1 Tax=Candidatus Albibeggiatoa sp. nov. BB20 TaxID=3162723 RepID=UPI0033656021